MEALTLRRRYRLGVAAVLLPLLLLIAGLAFVQYRSERAALLERLGRDSAELATDVDALVKIADDHVRQLRKAAEDAMQGRLPTPVSPLRAHLALERWVTDGAASDGLFLNRLAGTPLEPLVGNLQGRADILAQGNPLEIDMALGLFEPMRLAHLTAPFLRWSYYFSAHKDFMVLFPFAVASTEVAGRGRRSMREFMDLVSAYDVWRLGMPAQDPERLDYWTPVYLDAGGAGWMVSHAAPVYAADQFTGIVGTDILLRFLGDVLRSHHRPPGRAWIVDAADAVLADTGGLLPPEGKVPTLADRLLPGLASDAFDPSVGTPHQAGGFQVLSLAIAAAPWRLLVAVGDAELRGLVYARLWPYAILLGGLLLTLLAGQQLLGRMFVGPALALVQRVRILGLGEPGQAVSVPKVWRPWFTAVDEIFRRAATNLAQAREQETLKAAMIEAALDCIITIDEDGRVLEFNAGAQTTFGYSHAEALGRDLGELIVPPHLRAAHDAGMRRYMASGKAHVLGRRIEMEGMTSTGRLLPIELAIAEVRLDQRRMFTAYLRDITGRRQAEAELTRQREALHQSEKMTALGSLLAGVAHELNNPLSVVVGRAVMLEEDATDPVVRDSLFRLRGAAERCIRIVRSFLALARQRPRELRPVDLRPAVDSSLDMLAYGIRSSGVEIVRHEAADLPPAMADADQIHQVLLNLLLNATQAVEAVPPPRRVSLSLDTVGDMVRIEIADNGSGVPAELRHRVFDPFFTTKPVGMGTGLGLSVCQGIVEAHGGMLTLADDAGPGARFVVTLPAAAPANAPSPAAATSPPGAPGGRVLVADDEPDIVVMLADVLSRDGHEVTVANDGLAALDALRAREVDVILCDLRMPRLDGVGLLRQLAVDDPKMAARVILMTGDSLRAAGSLPLEAQGRLIEKPLDLGEVRRRVREVIDQVKAGDG